MPKLYEIINGKAEPFNGGGSGGGGGSSDAKSISFKSTSSISSSNTQDAIEEVDAKLGGVKIGQKDGIYGFYTGVGADTFIPFKIDILKDKLNDIVQGSISDNTGESISSANRVHIPNSFPINPNNKTFAIVAETTDLAIKNANVCLYEFKDDTYLGETSSNLWKNTPVFYTPTNAECNRLKIAFRFYNNANIVPSDITKISMVEI